MLSDRLTPSGTTTDAFGRIRISQPLTLFDSSHRYNDNGLWATSNTAGNSSYSFVENQSTIDMTVTTTASIGDQKEDELKKKGISLMSFTKRNYAL